MLFKVFHDTAMKCFQDVWKCAFLSSNNRLFFKGITIF
ncbi:hypothetical protein NP493_2029g00001 [Ridgeia piscesae]|uniref:Uncharacterized protein n=1 Tax=Ridgeia piscesae TaxID=27915 RepID=A0AAD9N6F6_RIDPI|nr:hypothetical protein NP493_2029g00001 [Ridgeia piscesae]